MAGMLERLKNQMKKEMDERVSILAPKIDESNKLLKQILAEVKEINANKKKG